MMSSRCTVVKLSGNRATPLPVSRPSFVIVFSISAGSCTSAMIGCTSYFAAASMNAPAKNVPEAGTESGLYIRATRASCGTISFNIETYFPAMLACRMVNPVMLPPGRATFGIAVLDAKVLAEGPALPFETLLESHQAASGFGIVAKSDQHPHGAHASCRLRICRDRPARECTAEQCDELASSHVDHGASPRFGPSAPAMTQVDEQPGCAGSAYYGAWAEILGTVLNYSESRLGRSALRCAF